jgi:arabinofuranan 3-O-arabinosyltransferase
MGPYYWLLDAIGVPDWVAQRLWLGTLLFAAGAGVLYLLRTFGLRGPGVVVAAIAYMLTPYTLDYSARISVLLMPWAALPWMIGLVRKALRDGGWRYPAIFALVVQIVGGVNATALLFAGVGPALWILYSWLVAREIPWRRALGVAAKTGALTLATSLWWIVGLSIQGGYGLNVLRYTETVEAVARTSTPNEIMRGLGYWFFYGQDRLGPWIEASSDYTQRPVVIVAGYVLVALALLAAGFVRWRHRTFFVGLLLVGVVIAVGAHPYDSPTPLGAVFKAFASGSSAGLAMRSTARAVPLVVLSTAVLLGVGTNAVYHAFRHLGRPALAVASVALVVVLVLLNFPAVIDRTFYGKNLERPEEIPQYWKDAAAALDARGDDTRVLELPGADFASYRWGNTVDPITPGLMDRPYVARELIPWGGPGSADLLNALDRHLQEGTFDPAAFAAVARRMGVGDVVLRNDLQYERYNLVTPRELNREFAAVPGLGPPTNFGVPAASLPALPSENQTSLAAPPNEQPVSPVVVYPVDNPTPIVRGESTHDALMIDGDGEGLLDAASVGLLEGAGVVQYAGSYVAPAALRAAVRDDTTLVLTDSNRRRARRWTSLADNVGVTEQPGERSIREDPGDARLDLFPAAGDATRSTTEQRGVAGVTATSYGNTITYTPEDRAALAFDGDTDTAWQAAAFGAAIGQHLRVTLDAPISADHVNLVQPLSGPRGRYITGVQLRFDGGDSVDAALDGSSRTPAGQTVAFPSRHFRQLDIEITDLNVGRRRLHGNANKVGFAEVRVRDEDTKIPVRVREVVHMPTDLLGATGAAGIDQPLVVLMSRERVLPIPPRHDPELAIAREFVLPGARSFALTGTARLNSDADADALARASGTTATGAGEVRASASASMEGCVACTAAAAIDGDPSTAWQTPFDDVRGQSVTYELGAPVTFDHLDFTVRADGRHSVPTRLLLDVDGAVRELNVPPIADQPAENATQTVRLDFPAVTGRRVRVEIADVRAVLTFSYYAQAQSVLPVAVAEVGVAGVRAPAPPTTLPFDCRSDLLRVDGHTVPVQIDGTPTAGTATAGTAGALSVRTCDPADPATSPPIELDGGSHVVEAAPGVRTAIDLDRLVLASAPGGQPLAAANGRVTGLDDERPPGPRVEVVDDGRTRMRVHVEGADEPFWLVLGQSANTGWRATTDGGDVGPRRLVDGYANGWLVDPSQGSFDVVLEWAPQRRVWASLGISLVACVFCAAVVAVTWWRRRAVLALLTAPDPSDAHVALEWPASERGARRDRRLDVVVALGAAVVGAVVAAPWIGVVVGAAVAVALRWRLGRVFLAVAPAVLMLVAGLYIAYTQIRYDTPAIFEWPTVFPRARTLAWFALLLTGATVVVDLVRRVSRRAPTSTG